MPSYWEWWPLSHISCTSRLLIQEHCTDPKITTEVINTNNVFAKNEDELEYHDCISNKSNRLPVKHTTVHNKPLIWTSVLKQISSLYFYLLLFSLSYYSVLPSNGVVVVRVCSGCSRWHSWQRWIKSCRLHHIATSPNNLQQIKSSQKLFRTTIAGNSRTIINFRGDKMNWKKIISYFHVILNICRWTAHSTNEIPVFDKANWDN